MQKSCISFSSFTMFIRFVSFFTWLLSLVGHKMMPSNLWHFLRLTHLPPSSRPNCWVSYASYFLFSLLVSLVFFILSLFFANVADVWHSPVTMGVLCVSPYPYDKILPSMLSQYTFNTSSWTLQRGPVNISFTRKKLLVKHRVEKERKKLAQENCTLHTHCKLTARGTKATSGWKHWCRNATVSLCVDVCTKSQVYNVYETGGKSTCITRDKKKRHQIS